MPDEATTPKKAAKKRAAKKAPRKPREPRESSQPAVVAPPPPSPVVIAIQEQILSLVGERAAVLGAVAASNAALRRAEADSKSAAERLSLIENEIQYRLQLCERMSFGQGSELQLRQDLRFTRPALPSSDALRAAAAGDSRMESIPDSGYGPLIQPNAGAMGSIPAGRPNPAPAAVEDIRSESAEEMRRAM